jgi:PAS domain S-box-containing protein
LDQKVDRLKLLEAWYALGPHKALDDLELGVIAVWEDGHVIWANREAESITGWPRPMLRDRHINVLVPEARRDGHTENIERWLRNPRARRMGELLGIQCQNRNGDLIDVEIQLLPNGIEFGMIILVGMRERKSSRPEEPKPKEQPAPPPHATLAS